MSDRSYLSIGDVLALLRDEFPDITISKIRFLESRGLLDPERTPSGYRKFCPPDVERLRWILRQQRENFLPLKVIKGRLEGADAGEPVGEEQLDEGDLDEDDLDEDDLDEDDGAAPLMVGGNAEPLVAIVHELVGAAANGPAERPPAATTGGKGASRRSASRAADSGRRGGAAGSGESETGDAPANDAQPARERGHGVERADEVPTGRGADGGEGGDEEVVPPEPELTVVATIAAEDAGFSGVSLTLGELAEAAGVSSEEIDALVEYGLIEGRSVAGVTCFDEESLIIARLAAGFARYGLEPRHVRIFKHAAEREAGLFAQVVTGMFRQRNPEARRRAYEALDDLSELGRGIHASLLRVALRDLTGG